MHQETADPIVWHRREYNKIADYIANHTVDVKKTWHKECRHAQPDLDLQEASFIFHSDGGTRAEQCSSAGWFLEAVVVRNDLRYTFPIALHGQYFAEPISSFLAEAMALDEAIAYFSKLVL